MIFPSVSQARCNSDAECPLHQICPTSGTEYPNECVTWTCHSNTECPEGRICGTSGSCETPTHAPGSVTKGGACTNTDDCQGAWACVDRICKECTTTDDCFGKGDCVSGTCACTSNADCPGSDRPKCHPTQHACVECITNDDCPGKNCTGGLCMGAPAPEEKYKYEPVYPKLQIPIPGIPSLTEFAKVEIKGEPGERYVYIPWISQYIAAVYGWTMGIVGILATVMIVWGGVIYLTAGGTPERISTAKDYITSALAGLLLAFGSYLLLYTINPDLVKFGAMKIKVIERIDFEDQLSTTTADTGPDETLCATAGKDAAKKAAYEKFKNEIPGWPDSWTKDLVPGDRIIIFNANSGPAGLHAAIFMGWAGTGNAKTVWGSYKGLVKEGNYCIGSNCPSPTPLVRVFKLNTELESQMVKNLPSGCPIQLTNPYKNEKGEIITGPNNPRAQEFKEKIKPYLTSWMQRERVLQAAQYAVNCQVNLGSCGKTADILDGLADAGRGTRTHAISGDQSNYLNTIKCPK